MNDRNKNFSLINDDNSVYEIDNECMKKKENGIECSEDCNDDEEDCFKKRKDDQPGTSQNNQRDYRGNKFRN